MAERPGINDVVSVAFDPRVVDVAGAMVPGLFFESSLLLGRPVLAISVLSRAGVEAYAPIVVVLVVAFVLGSVAVSWVRVLEWFLIVTARRFLPRMSDSWANFLRNQLRPAEDQSVYAKFLRRRLDLWNRDALEHIQRVNAWTQIAAAILRRHGIESPPVMASSGVQFDSELWARWKPWSEVLGRMRLSDLPGHSLVELLHSVGWIGLAAYFLAPSLKTPPYVGLCAFLIAFGLMHELRISWHLGGNTRSWAVGLNSTMRQLERLELQVPTADSTADASKS